MLVELSHLHPLKTDKVHLPCSTGAIALLQSVHLTLQKLPKILQTYIVLAGICATALTLRMCTSSAHFLPRKLENFCGLANVIAVTTAVVICIAIFIVRDRQ